MTAEQCKTRFINRWKRNNNRKTKFGNRTMRAYNVPGTREHGELCMWKAQPAESFVPVEVSRRHV